MIYTEKIQDVFSVDSEYYLAHCISGDFTLGAGVAKAVDKKYDMRFKLFRDYPIANGTRYGYVGKALLVDHVFNLVTKDLFCNKPSYKNLQLALQDMKTQCLANGITKIAMPLIGCGRDKLNWSEVSDWIVEIFDDTDIEILVCKR